MFNPQLDVMKLRTVEVKQNGEWTKTNMIDIKKGQTFRMFEPNGDPVEDDDGCTVWTTDSNAYMNELGIPTVKISC